VFGPQWPERLADVHVRRCVHGLLLTHPAISIPFKSEITALPVDLFEKFFVFTSKPLKELKLLLKSERVPFR
jgi:hypothetical protein